MIKYGFWFFFKKKKTISPRRALVERPRPRPRPLVEFDLLLLLLLLLLLEVSFFDCSDILMFFGFVLQMMRITVENSSLCFSFHL